VNDQLPLQFASSADRDVIVRVWDVIRRHSGSEDPISIGDVARLADVTERNVQAAVKLLVEDLGKPIGSNWRAPYGYYVITNEDELRQNFQRFLRRGVSNLKHARAYNSASVVGQVVGQLEIEIEENR
jgi:hypothetical protein